MKRIFLAIFSICFLVPAFAQLTPVSVDLGFSDAHFEDVAGNVINANAISYNQVVKIKVNVINFSETDAAPGGHYRIRVGLGAGMVLNAPASLATAPLSSYFTWSYDLSGAQPQIVGTSVASLPADFLGTAEFELKAATPLVSTVSYNLLISNPVGTTTPLSDPAPANNVAANTYSVAEQLSFNVTKTNVTCNGAGNGSLTITPSGGISPYSFKIVNANTNAEFTNTTGIFNNLVPATYNITVIDDALSTATGSESISQPAAVSISSVNQTAIQCFNGTATVSIAASGGTAPYKYTFNGIENSTGEFSNVAAGTYAYSVTDANNCPAATGNFTVLQPTQLTISKTGSTNNACNNGSAGTITVAGSGGTQGYTYTISGPTVNTSGRYTGQFTGLSAGTYNVTVKDANNCTALVSNIVISHPAGTRPDMTLSAADYTDNFFATNGAEVSLIFQINEVGGNAAIKDTLVLTNQTGYSFTPITSATVNISGNVYPLDNSRWIVNTTTPGQYRLALADGEQMGCGESKFIGIKIKRNTSNKSVFTLTSTLRPATHATNANVSTNKETNLTNNATTVVLVGQ